MKDILDISTRLKHDNYRFTFDGDSTFEFPLGNLKVIMFVEMDGDRPILVQYEVVPEDDSEMTIYNEHYDEYVDKGLYNDLDMDNVVGYLEEALTYAKELNRNLVRIEQNLDIISNIMEDNEIEEDIVIGIIRRRFDIN